MTMIVPLRFSLEDAHRANDDWGANCGPGAIAAVMGLTLDELRPSMGDFEQKHYTNPTLMWEVLDRLGAKWRLAQGQLDSEVGVGGAIRATDWPSYGLVRIQWEGPWTKPGVPMRARYRHTHWVGAKRDADRLVSVFDINAMAAGGWISAFLWMDSLVPWLLTACEPKADGKWHITHAVEVHL